MAQQDDRPRSMLSKAIDKLLTLDSPQQIFQLLGLLVFIALGVGIFTSHGEFVKLLQDDGNSRGLITFLIVATMVSIAIIITIYAVSSKEAVNEIKERFGFAKEVLTVLVGIVGTILGFYYGSSNSSSMHQIEIANFQLEDSTLVTYAAGGTPPYRFTITYDALKDSTLNGISVDGWIKTKLKMLPKKSEKVSLAVSDAKDSKALKIGSADFKESASSITIKDSSIKSDSAPHALTPK